MNNFGPNGGSPGGMKRRLVDPRQRLQQGRFGPGPGRGPGPGPGRGHQRPQQFPPPPPRHQQQHPMGPGRGPPQQPPFGPGRGGRPPNHLPPLGGPGRGGFPMHQQPGPPHMGNQNQHQFPPGPHPGRGGSPMNRGPQAPPPPPPQRPPFRPPPAMNNNFSRMNNGPPTPMGMGYGQNMTPPAPPPPRQPFQASHQQHPPHYQGPPPMHSPPPPRHHQPVQPPQQQGGMMPPFHAQPQQPPPQHQHQQHVHAPQRPQPPNHYQQVPMLHHGAHTQRQPYAAMSGVVAKPPIQQHQQQQQQPAAAVTGRPPKSVSTPYSQAQIDQAWSEHTNNGVKYYHNSILQTSTYTKPDALKVQAQQKAQSAHSQQVKKPAETPTAAAAWAEYTDANTGKKYYSDGAKTTWEKPEGFVSPAAIVAQSNAAEEAASSLTQESSKKKRKVKDSRETPFRNSEEAVAAFKGLLLAKGVSPTQKWNEVVKMCSSDARWDDCEAVLTTGERKQAMAEYQTKRFNDLKDQERQERTRAKDAFNQLLSEVLPKLPAFSALKTRFSDIRDSISKDDRFYAVPTENAREGLYLDFCEELRKHDERKKRNKKRETQDAFCLFLKEKEEAGNLSFSSTWNTFQSSLSPSDKEDSRFKVSQAMTDPDRQLYFADFVIELQAAEDDKRRRIRDARRRAEKAQREAYRDALEKIAKEGRLIPSSHWRDIERTMAGDSAYEAVMEQDRDAPRELFEEFIDEWEDIYRRDRQFLSQLVHPSSNREILVTRDTSYDAFVKALLEEANNSPQTYAEAKRITKTEEPRSSARLYFNELATKAKEKNAVPFRRRSLGSRRGSIAESSSEDEGEIIEEGEEEDGETQPKATEAVESKSASTEQGVTTEQDSESAINTAPTAEGKESEAAANAKEDADRVTGVKGSEAPEPQAASTNEEKTEENVASPTIAAEEATETGETNDETTNEKPPSPPAITEETTVEVETNKTTEEKTSAPTTTEETTEEMETNEELKEEKESSPATGEESTERRKPTKK